MTTFTLRTAERKQAKLRIGLSAPSGAGKTYSALLMALGLASSPEKIVIIDTEAGSGELYSHLGGYNVLPLEAPFSPERYIEAVKACEDAGMEVIIIDSTSHEWEGKGGCLELNELIAQAKFRGNTWSAWSETGSRHQKFIQAILTSKCHIITATRNKTETVMTEDKKVKKVGTKEIQRDGFEYELTVNFNIDRDTHKAMPSKDRTELFEGKDPFTITKETGKMLLDWANSGAVVTASKVAEVKTPASTTPTPALTKEDLVIYMAQNFPQLARKDTPAFILEKTGLDVKEKDYTAIIDKLSEILEGALKTKPADKLANALAK